MPDEHTDVTVFTRCLRALSNKLSMPRPGSFSQPSTVDLLLPTLMSWFWICVCFFLNTINPQTFCFCLFLSTWPSKAFYKISPTYLQGLLVLVIGTEYSFLISHLNFPQATLLSFSENDIIPGNQAKRRVWLPLNNQCPISKSQLYSHSNVLPAFCLVSILCSSSKQQITSSFLMWGNNSSFPASCTSGEVLAWLISAVFLLTLSSLQGGILLNF